jgi:hypothetical protein
MPAYPYKSQVQIVLISMTLHNYIRRKSEEDVAFTEYDHNPNFILDNFLADVILRSQSQGNLMHSQMNYVCDGIINSLME